MATDSPHARDLGYLERFIAKLEAEAAQLPADRRAKALAMLANERSEWRTIMALLAGEPVTAAPAGPAPTEGAAKASPSVPTPMRTRLTVGSLIGKP